MTRRDKRQYAIGITALVVSVASLIFILTLPVPPQPGAVPALPAMVPVDTGAENFAAAVTANANDAPPPGVAFGYVPDPLAVQAFVAGQPQTFAATPTGQTQEIPRAVYLWQIHKALTGDLPREKDQNPAGSCVGHGGTTATERSEACEIYARVKTGDGDASEFTYFAEEVTYAGARVEAARLLHMSIPRGDGASGAGAAKWLTEFGPLPKGKYGKWDLTTYSASRAQSWNYTGVPDELEPECAKYKVGDAALITTWSDAKRSLANNYGISICSNIGFNRQRDANGVATPGPQWQHCMCLDGYHTDEQGREYGHIENSWAKTNYHVGPVGWGSPSNAGFWADAQTIQRMLSQGESFAFSGAKGFPRQAPLDWFATAPARRQVIEVANLFNARKDLVPCSALAW